MKELRIGQDEETLAGHESPHTATGRRPGAAELRRGTVIGRYVVLSKLGAGGMGVVYAAYDPELDRKIGLKLIRPRIDGPAGADSRGRTRLLREAQALARLQHPNVVTVHDVGTHEDRVWLAMELVEGKTLGAWIEEQPRSWPEVLDVLVRAGRGVAAAHAAELLHRDLKPDNIMVASDGRVRVMDFGLVTTRNSQALAPSPMLQDIGVRSSIEALSTPVTRVGALVGTPSYMAPEQIRGDSEIGPAADQFSFCVTAWEALFGERPFSGEKLVDLAASVLSGRRRPPPARSRVPGWLRRVLERGLCVEPSQRWPSMDTLLDALQRGQSKARWRRGFQLVGVLGVSAALFGGWLQVDEQRRIAACEQAGESIAGVWNDNAREELRAALVGTGVSYAGKTADKVMPWFDMYARAWQTTRTEACLDSEVRGTWDPDLFDRGLWCLDERRMELEALVTELSRSEATSVDKVVLAAAALGQIESCREVDLLRRRSSPPKQRRDEIRSVRAELSRVTALRQTGAYDEGRAVARDALARAQSLEWPPLIAEAHLGLGALLESTGDYEGAAETLEAAYFGAIKAGGAPEVAVAAAVQLVYTVGYRLARHEEGLRWSRHVEVALASAPDLAQLREADHLANVAKVHHATGAYENAKPLYERALAIRAKALGPEHPKIAVLLNNLAALHRATGAFEEAKALYERGLAISEKGLGPEHPIVAAILTNLANVHAAMGSLEEAKALHRRALVIQKKALGPEHADLASSLNNLARVHREAGENEEAKTLYERALAISEKALGPEHPIVATSLNNLANVHHDIGADETAKVLHERALAIRQRALGPEHPEVATSLNNLADLHHAAGAHEEAKTLYERSLAIREQALGPEHPNLAYPLIGLGNVALVQHRADDAVPLVERAVELRNNADASPNDIAGARFVLAQALWESNRERPRAVDLARQARDAYQDAGAAELADVEAWLAIHEGSQ